MDKTQFRNLIAKIELGAGVVMVFSLPLSEGIKNISFGFLFLCFIVQRFIKRDLYCSPLAKGL